MLDTLCCSPALPSQALVIASSFMGSAYPRREPLLADRTSSAGRTVTVDYLFCEHSPIKIRRRSTETVFEDTQSCRSSLE
jgi:hypothetical protein